MPFVTPCMIGSYVFRLKVLTTLPFAILDLEGLTRENIKTLMVDYK